MKTKFVPLFLIFCFGSGYAIWLDPDTGKNLYQFMDAHGLQYENHSITSQDNYIVNTIRLPGPRNDGNQTKPAVLYIHGQNSNPQDFMFQVDRSSVYMFLKAGYEVWLMAARGSTYSLGHKYLQSSHVPYWNFSFHEIGIYDIPVHIDYICNLTGNTQISFIGHSLGGTAFLAFAATYPELQTKVAVAHLWGGFAYMDHARITVINAVKKYWGIYNDVFTFLGQNKASNPHSKLYYYLGIVLCSRDSPFLNLCLSLLGFAGPDPTQLNTSRITVLGTNDPAGGSFKTSVHYLQMANSSKFALYDYRHKNQLYYGQPEPPLYNLSAITQVPVVVWYGLNDYMAGPLDYQRTASEIPTGIDKPVKWALWNHLDFAIAKDADEWVYKELIQLTTNYTNSS